MGEGFYMLEKVLHSDSDFLSSASGSVSPAMFLLSDGGPTDDYKKALAVLKENNWYKVSAKVGVGYGTQCDDGVLEEFTGNPETVLHTNDVNDLVRLIRFVTLTTTMVASKGKVTAETSDKIAEKGNEDSTNAVAEALKSAKAELSNAVDPEDEF